MSKVVVSEQGLHELLRYSMPGYVLVFLLLLPFANYLSGEMKTYGTLFAGLLLVAGPVVGFLFSNMYNGVYRFAVWYLPPVRYALRLAHIKRLMLLKSKSLKRHEIMGIYDKRFFLGESEFVERILFLTSRAHYWGIIAFGMGLMPVLWWFVDATFVRANWLFACSISSPVPVGQFCTAYLFALGTFILLFIWSIWQASAIENVFIVQNWRTICRIAQRYVRGKFQTNLERVSNQSKS